MQKHTTLFLLFLAVSFSMTAQIKKRATLLGVDLGFNGGTSKQQFSGIENKTSSSGFNASLLLGKAVKDNLFIGGGLAFNSTTYTSGTPEVKQTSTSYGASVWSRKYFPVLGPLYAFVNGSLYGNAGKTENPNSNFTKSNNFDLGVSVYPGISLQLKKSFYIDASLNNLANIYYNHNKSERNDTGGVIIQTASNYGISTSLGNGSNPLQLGIRWIFSPKS